MAETKKSLYIEWVRSGIGFPRRQKEMVRSLGLRRLHQVVERPDTPQIRGLVAKISHLVRVLERQGNPSKVSSAEYVILLPEPKGETAAAPAEAPAAKQAEAAASEAEAARRLTTDSSAEESPTAPKRKKPAPSTAVTAGEWASNNPPGMSGVENNPKDQE